ncbi:uncharacterized protein BX664DRAFT_384918 [Halteromyces radiatus]|uniref:uncharacterized protein n=1 Tax=Halteromyces radiatus TaxID=101107 RepID=UPI00221F5F66|nr:uncharacterized protein BX664DRAFT_384918 [Halteromyces radiatus]KAI8093497.1 hypothetical protein BX664DRAFT_384918 [Halteromyces radiatus]
MNANTQSTLETSTFPSPESLNSSPRSDFRNATIENHWNDPPKKIFHKTNHQDDDGLDKEELKTRLTILVETCRTAFTTGPNKRIVDDTSKRVQVMLKEIDDEKVTNNVIISINELCRGLEEKDWEKALTLHRQLMTTEYERHGSWLLGLKRLIDLSEKIPSSS